MKKLIIVTVIIVLSGTMAKLYSWNIINTGINQRFVDICFINDSTGFAVGDSGTIIKTSNSGKDWIALYSGSSEYLKSVFFVNSSVGYVAGGTSTTSTVLKTIDAGNTWITLNTGISKMLCDIFFTSPDSGYAVGYSGKIIKTVDGGQTWIDLPNVTSLAWYSLHFFNSNVGIVAGRVGKIIKTVDGGQTWVEIQNSGNGVGNAKIQFISPQIGYLASGTKILKTGDAGNSWFEMGPSINSEYFNSVYFLNENLGYISGEKIYKTTDGGISWTMQTSPEGNSAFSLYFINSTTGYATCNAFKRGNLLKTNIGGGFLDFDFADGNNINARFNMGGSMFWDMENYPAYEIPKGSGHQSMFASSIWMGGKDVNNQLHLFGNRYHGYGFDLFPGPVMNCFNTDEELWSRIWKISRAEIEYHIANWATPGYQMPVNISEWPGNGDVSKGQTAVIAPYFDSNQDGLYNPQYGDYPIIKGDNALFFVMNDSARMHTESGGLKMGVEIRTMAYSFDCPGDSALWNTLFLNYEIINRSQNNYDSTFFGFFADVDLGDPYDDYIGCDVARSSFYGYNGDQLDGDGQGITYGTNPPAQSVTFLGGPYMNPDGSDFGSSGIPDGCDESINGLGFNDGIIDNECLGMSSFMYFNNSASTTGDPATAQEYYYYLTARWKDGSPMHYGGNGQLSDTLTCKFMFPNNTDSCGWGTEGIPRPAWTELTENNSPDDRRGVGAMGPFTMLPGSVHNVDIAFVFGRDFTNPNPWAGVINMQQRIDSVRKYFNLGQTPCGTFNIGVNENKTESVEITVYPNPAQNYFVVKAESLNEIKSIRIYTLEGTLVNEESAAGFETRICTDKLSNGLYIVEVKSKNSSQYKKVIVAK